MASTTIERRLGHRLGQNPVERPYVAERNTSIDRPDGLLQLAQEFRARPVTLFDEASPANFLLEEIGKFFRKERARQDSNLRPPA
jgi:hypothetical protein